MCCCIIVMQNTNLYIFELLRYVSQASGMTTFLKLINVTIIL